MGTRIFLLLLIMVLAVVSAGAQDIIHKKTGEEVPAIVVDVSPGVIKYKKPEKPNGPVFSIAREQVDRIVYESGKVVYFAQEEDEEAEAEPSEKEEISKAGKTSPVLGWHLGMGASSIYGDIEGSKIQLASTLGATFTLPVGQNNSILLGLDILSLGCGLDDIDYTDPSDSSRIVLSKLREDLGYVSLLLMDRFFLNPNRNYYVEGGFYASFLMAGTITGEGVITDTLGMVTSGAIEETLVDIYKSYDIGLSIGFGGRIPLDKKNKWHLTAGARFYYGLTNIADIQIPGFESYSESNIFGLVFIGVDIATKSSK